MSYPPSFKLLYSLFIYLFIYCPRRTNETGFVRVCVRPCVRPMLKFASSLSFLWKFTNYANLFKINEKCYFSSISWPILILFVLSDRAGWGLQNFYTEFWNSLIMQIYANLFKINEKCYFSVISWPILILFVLSDRAWCGLQNFYTEFWNSLIMQIYANLFKINEKCHLSSIQKSQQICTSGGDVYYASRNLLSTCLFIYSLKP